MLGNSAEDGRNILPWSNDRHTLYPSMKNPDGHIYNSEPYQIWRKNLRDEKKQTDLLFYSTPYNPLFTSSRLLIPENQSSGQRMNEVEDQTLKVKKQ